VLAPTPSQNCLRPPPVPPEPTTGVLNSGKALPNSSAAMDENGSTVEEPAIWMVSRDCAKALPAKTTASAAVESMSLFMEVTPVGGTRLGRPLASGMPLVALHDSWMTVSWWLRHTGRPAFREPGPRPPPGLPEAR